MNKFIKGVKDFLKEEDGLTTVEYAVAGALVAATVVLAFTNLGGEVCKSIDSLSNAIASDPVSSDCPQ